MTIAQLTGIPVGQIHNSYSLVPLLTNNNATTGRPYLFTEYCSANGNTERYAIRGDRYKLLYNNGDREMYDLVLDSLETTDLYDNPSFAAEQTALEAELATLAAAAVDGCFDE